MRLSTITSIVLFFLIATLSDTQLCAQVLQDVITKIKNAKNISYTDVITTKLSFEDNFATDTVRSVLSVVPGEPQIGGYYSLTSRKNRYDFDGSKLLTLNMADSTYQISKESVAGQHTRTLLYWVKEFEKFAAFSAKKVFQLPDTNLRDVKYAVIRIAASDTIVTGERCYTFHDVIFDKRTLLPVQISTRSRGLMDGTVIGAIESHAYSDYIFNVSGLDNLSAAVIPAYFKLPVKLKPVALLSAGTPALNIKALDLQGRPLSLQAYQGKTVLLNFSLIGCPHCVASAKMLNNLYEKYHEKELVILNIYPIDLSDAVRKFDQRFAVKNQSFIASNEVQKLYPYDGYPTFYLIGKNGMIRSSYNGYYQGLEEELEKEISKE